MEPTWCKYFMEMPTNSEFYGWVETIHQVETIKHAFEMATKSRFPVLTTKAANFGNTDVHQHSHFVRFQDRDSENQVMPLLTYSGIPYLDLNKQVLDCNRGFRREQKAQVREHNYNEKKKRNVQPTKRVGCPARIYIREVAFFPDFSIDKDSEHKRKTASKNLRTALKEKQDVRMLRRFYILFPQPGDHVNHGPEDVDKRPCSIHKRLKRKVGELVLEGIVSPTEVKRHLKLYIMSEKNNWFGDGNPPATRRFFPTDKAIRNCISTTVAKHRDHHLDQERLEKQMIDWKNQNFGETFFYRAAVKDDNSTDDDLKFTQSFLFVYQTKVQKRLLDRYGNEMCLLDATYRTTKFLLPLYFVSVKTNVNYQPVACFITMNESTELIYEALAIIREWNPTWAPKCFMTEFAEQEVIAITKLFPETLNYLCDFYVELSWQKWLKIKSHELSECTMEILTYVRAIAEAATEEKFEQAIDELKASEMWHRSMQLQNYFNSVWYPNRKKWARAFCTDSLIVSTYSGIERLNGDLRHNFLNKTQENEISSLVRILRNNYFPAKYEKYVNANMRCGNSNKKLPEYLRNRPREMVNHCLLHLEESKTVGLIQTVEGSATFFVSRGLDDLTDQHCVFLGSSEQLPHCDCDEWIKFKWPCKHLFAVLAVIENGWDNLPYFYRNSVFNTLDEEIETPEIVDSKLGIDIESVEQNVQYDCTEFIVAEVLVEPEDLRSECRNMLNQFSSMTYSMNDNAIAEFLVKLEELNSWVESQVVHNQVTANPDLSLMNQCKIEVLSNDDDSSDFQQTKRLKML